MKSTRKLLSTLERVHNWCMTFGAAFAGFLIVFIMLVMATHVVMRYFLLMPIKWAVEVTEYLMVWITFLGAAWVLKKGGHIKIDILVSRLSPRKGIWLLIVTYFLIAAICLFVTVYGGIVTYDALIRGAARTYLYATPLWILLIIIPIGSLLLFMEALRIALSHLQSKRQKYHEP